MTKMEKSKKDLESLLYKQTEKLLNEIDPAAAIIFSKNIKGYSKDLAKKFLKLQKKFQKQMEAVAKMKTDLPNVSTEKKLNIISPTISKRQHIEPKMKTVKTSPSSKKTTPEKLINTSNNSKIAPKKKMKLPPVKKVASASKKQ